VAETGNETFAGAITNAGALTKSGVGTTRLSGANTYSGATTIAAGTLQIGDGGTTGAIGSTSGIAISNGATLAFNRTDSYGGNFTQTISGAGGVALSAGTLTLQNTGNNFTGGVTVNGGTFKSSGNSAGNTIVVNNGGTLAMAGNDTWGNATISNSPLVTINSGGIMTSDGQFNSLRNLTLNGGTVTLNGGYTNNNTGAFGFGGTVTAGGALTSTITATTGSANFIRLGRESTNEPTIFHVEDPSGQLQITAPLTNNFGVISGLQKTGDGTLVLSGANGYTGTTKVSGGTLVVSNSIFTATIQSGSTTVNFAALPSPGTNNVLPGPLDAASLNSVNLTGPGGPISGTLTNSPNLIVIVNSNAPVGPTFASTYPSGSENTVDSNGLQNLMNYALGGTGPGSNPALPVLTSDASSLTLTANIRNSGQGVSVVGQYAYDLVGPWLEDKVSTTTGGSIVENTKETRFSIQLEPGQPRKFLRLKAVVP
jgi:autotransporter-associated beta strand protein